MIRCYTSPSATSSSGALSLADPTTATTRPFFFASSTSFSPADNSPVGVKAEVAGSEMLGGIYYDEKYHLICPNFTCGWGFPFSTLQQAWCQPPIACLCPEGWSSLPRWSFPPKNKAYELPPMLTTFSSFRVLTGRGLIWRGPVFRSPESCSRHVREAGVDVNTFNVNIAGLLHSVFKKGKQRCIWNGNQRKVKYFNLHAGGNHIVNVYSRHVREEEDALVKLQVKNPLIMIKDKSIEHLCLHELGS